MVELALATVGAVFGFLIFCWGYSRGKRDGRDGERFRVSALMDEALRLRYSASVNWVYNGVLAGRKHLMPAEEFFGAETLKKFKEKHQLELQ